jgi:hypothetical protein
LRLNTIPSVAIIASVLCSGRTLFRIEKSIHVIFAVVICMGSRIRPASRVPTLLESRSLAIRMYRSVHCR